MLHNSNSKTMERIVVGWFLLVGSTAAAVLPPGAVVGKEDEGMASSEGFFPFGASGGRQLQGDDYLTCGLSLVFGAENNECCDANQNVVRDDCSDLDPTRHLMIDSDGNKLDENKGLRGQENDSSLADEDFGRNLQAITCGISIAIPPNQCCSSNRNIVGRACCPEGDTPQGLAYNPTVFECCSNQSLFPLAVGCPSSAPSRIPSRSPSRIPSRSPSRFPSAVPSASPKESICPISESVECSASKGSKKGSSSKGKGKGDGSKGKGDKSKGKGDKSKGKGGKGKGKGDETETSDSIFICVDGETVCQNRFDDPGTFYDCGPCEPFCPPMETEPCHGKGKGDGGASFIKVCIDGHTVCQDLSMEPDQPYTCGPCGRTTYHADYYLP